MGCPLAILCPRWKASLVRPPGLSAAAISRLSKRWTEDYHAFCQRDLSGVDYVYVWVDDIHVNVRLEEDKLCLLVIVGVCADGSKELAALADGYRESTGSWADVLPDCARRGMRAPVLAVGDGALGSWPHWEVFPDSRKQRCWFHKAADVLSALAMSAHPGAEAALAEIYNAEDKQHAPAAVKTFTYVWGEVRQGHRDGHRRPGRGDVSGPVRAVTGVRLRDPKDHLYQSEPNQHLDQQLDLGRR